MDKYFKHIKDIIFIILLIRLTYIEYNNLYLLVELASSLLYIFIPNDISNKSNSIDNIE